jgi:hypothetical protein
MVRVILMRSPIESVPKDGQFVIVEDESGNDDVARWSPARKTWVGLNGEPIAILPTHWWPMPTGGAPPHNDPPPLPPGVALPHLNGARSSAAASRASKSPVSASHTTAAMSVKPVSAGLCDGQSNVVPLRNRTRQAPRRRRSFPLFSVSLFSVVALGALTASIMRDDSAGDFRGMFAWRHGFESMSAAAHPPGARRAIEVAGPEEQRPIEQDVVLTAAVDRPAVESRANLNATDGKPAQGAKAIVRLDQPPEQKRESGEAAGLNVKVTSDVVALARRPDDGALEARIMRPADSAPLRSDLSASRAPADADETAKLIERATGLLKQGDIGGARWVLLFAQDMGSAWASFMLAETYDPRILATWRVMGTRADPAKARELYAKAYAQGIVEAKGRMEALAE